MQTFEVQPQFPEFDTEEFVGLGLLKLRGICFRVELWEAVGQSMEADGSDLITIHMLGRAQQGRELRETKLSKQFNLIRASDRAALEQLFLGLGIDLKQPITVRLNQMVGKYVEVHNIRE